MRPQKKNGKNGGKEGGEPPYLQGFSPPDSVGGKSQNIHPNDDNNNIDINILFENGGVGEGVDFAALPKGLQERLLVLQHSLVPYVKKYGKEMISDFYSYWSELNNSRTRMRRDDEKTWEVSKRLALWERNSGKFKYQNSKFKNNGYGKTQQSDNRLGFAAEKHEADEY